MKIKFFILAALCMATISIYAQNFNGLDMNIYIAYPMPRHVPSALKTLQVRKVKVVWLIQLQIKKK